MNGTIETQKSGLDFGAAVVVALNDRLSLPHAAGVYVVCHGETVLYVGHSSNIKARWVTHHRSRDFKKYSGDVLIYCFLMSREQAIHEEYRLINELSPLLNKRKRDQPDTYLLDVRLSHRVGKLERMATEAGMTVLDFMLMHLNSSPSIKAAAKQMGMSYEYIVRKMAALGIEHKWRWEIIDG